MGVLRSFALSLSKGSLKGTSHLIVVPAEAGFLPQEPSPTQRGGAGRSPFGGA